MTVITISNLRGQTRKKAEDGSNGSENRGSEDVESGNTPAGGGEREREGGGTNNEGIWSIT